MATHSYQEKLNESQDEALCRQLDSVYRQLFPAQAIERVIYDASASFQLSGRDLRVELRAPHRGRVGLSIFETIEEKIRSPEQSGWPDLLIEYLSNQEHGTVGWIYSSTADWLSYVRQPRGWLDVLVLPMQALRCWFIPRRENYRDVPSKTRLPGGGEYTTLNKAVPFSEPAFSLFWRANGCRRFRTTAATMEAE